MAGPAEPPILHILHPPTVVHILYHSVKTQKLAPTHLSSFNHQNSQLLSKTTNTTLPPDTHTHTHTYTRFIQKFILFLLHHSAQYSDQYHIDPTLNTVSRNQCQLLCWLTWSTTGFKTRICLFKLTEFSSQLSVSRYNSHFASSEQPNHNCQTTTSTRKRILNECYYHVLHCHKKLFYLHPLVITGLIRYYSQTWELPCSFSWW